ncbi:Flagellar motor switch protein FliG [Candidatus Megaera venefica]|uniref:Flagellar motor switch protein FliG n=1 Tax=Candidatus Megaera venefica TaxID=2055910 RepID=A0ABU5ND09_9RICK|nr:flagellar motor switch protein FliG [Candidatus Megaera venefica]MEA0971048.1 Flagellar motor switch protein FliG [Candidatus Megaera venefica]
MGVTAKDIEKLTGSQKVAIVLLSLSDENATRIFSLMSEDEITDISHAMSHLGAVSPEVIDSVMDQLAGGLTGDSMFLGNLHSTERLLEKILDKDRVSALMDEIRGPQGRNTWEKLANVNEELLALYFRNEHPQTAALVLSKISPDHAAKVLSNLPDGFAFEIISRILSIGSVKKEVLERVERILRAEFISSVGKTQKYDSFEMLAEIFNNLDRNSESKFMTMLEANLPDAAAKIKDMMFTFDDLIKIDSKGIQRLLRDVEKSRLTLALKGAPDEVKNVLFSSMSQRAAKIIEEDLMALGSVRVKDVDAARGDVVAVAKKLIEAGEIDVALNSNDDEFVT